MWLWHLQRLLRMVRMVRHLRQQLRYKWLWCNSCRPRSGLEKACLGRLLLLLLLLHLPHHVLALCVGHHDG